MHGLKEYNLKVSTAVMTYIIENFTRESGVRELDRQLASIMRSLAKDVAIKGKMKAVLTLNDITRILGKPRYSNDLYKTVNMPGVAVGLAWTYVGGDILFIESTISDGKGDLQLTGNLGNVMKESAHTAFTYLHANAKKNGIDPELFKRRTFIFMFLRVLYPRMVPVQGLPCCQPWHLPLPVEGSNHIWP